MGDVYACGCEDAPCFGNVNTEVNIPDEWDPCDCHKSLQNTETKAYVMEEPIEYKKVA